MNRQTLILLASMLITFVLGSVHAFSVFLQPLEASLHLPRSQVSLIYSFALMAITFAVLIGYRIYKCLPAWWLLLLTCLMAAAGLLVSADAASWWQLFAGYSLMFGVSNGIGYGYCLQLVGREMPRKKGFAMGAVTAAYAVGSIVFAKIFALQIAALSIAAAFQALALALLVCGCVAAVAMRYAAASYETDALLAAAPPAAIAAGKILPFWLAYMTSVFAGLMAIGHAAAIAVAKGADLELSTLSAMVIGIGSALGGFLAGGLIDRWPARRLLVGLPLLSALALLMINVSDGALLVVAWLSLVGFSYGAVIAVYPVVISDYFGEQGARAYGLVFTAWGFAGLAGPWLAGLVYDWRSAYDLALSLAAGCALLSAMLAAALRLQRQPE